MKVWNMIQKFCISFVMATFRQKKFVFANVNEDSTGRNPVLSLGRYGLWWNTDLLYNEKNIFPNLIPWKMDAPSYKAALENGKGIKLSSGKQKS